MGDILARARLAQRHMSVKAAVEACIDAVAELRSKAWPWTRIGKWLHEEGVVLAPIPGPTLKRYATAQMPEHARGDVRNGAVFPRGQAARPVPHRAAAVVQVVPAEPKRPSATRRAGGWTDIVPPAPAKGKGADLLAKAGIGKLDSLLRPLDGLDLDTPVVAGIPAAVVEPQPVTQPPAEMAVEPTQVEEDVPERAVETIPEPSPEEDEEEYADESFVDEIPDGAFVDDIPDGAVPDDDDEIDSMMAALEGK